MNILDDGKASRSTKKDRKEAEMSEAEEMSEDEEYHPSSDAEESDTGSEDSTSESESGSDIEEDAKRSAEVLKRKIKAQKNIVPMKKQKNVEKEKKVRHKKTSKKDAMKTPKQSKNDEKKNEDNDGKDVSAEKKKEIAVGDAKTSGNAGEEGQFDLTTLEKDEKDTDVKKSKKRETPVFNDKNLDYNLFNDAPENVMARKIKISNTVLVTCKMIDAITGGATGGLSYDYAALTFMRKIQNQKAFEFNLPLSLAPNIIEALKLIMKDNPKFFKRNAPQNTIG